MFLPSILNPDNKELKEIQMNELSKPIKRAKSLI